MTIDPTGRWRLNRLVADGVARRLVRGSGVLVATPGSPGTWRLVETLTFDGYDGRRESLWRISGDSLDICYADGAPLVRFDLELARPDAVHLCAPDRYEARLRNGFPDRFALGWRVVGPRKDYAMVTNYQRLG
ncbi:MAG: DUF6314 family protein [Alphaproteobacteria bacterium]|nr:DUF6314 family protein [Alphaproteobacteria bacterium]